MMTISSLNVLDYLVFGIDVLEEVIFKLTMQIILKRKVVNMEKLLASEISYSHKL